jgi:RNA polymerase-binding transcription factor DksA
MKDMGIDTDKPAYAAPSKADTKFVSPTAAPVRVVETKVFVPKTKSEKAAAAGRVLHRPIPKAPASARPISIPRTLDVEQSAPEENEDAFSDMPQEPERFSPVPMASRLQRPSVKYSDKDLAEFRTHIENERKKAMEEFQMLRENLDDLTNSEMADENASYSMHMAEQGTDAQEKEKLYAHVQRVSDYVKKLDEALQRIGDKVYGICKMCGILIAKERLLAVPITTQSASYKLRKRCPEDGIDRIVPVRK